VADDALPELHGERVTLRPLAAEHAEGLRAIRRTQPVADWWGPLEEDFPGDDEPTARRHAILVGDELASMIQFTEENEPDCATPRSRKAGFRHVGITHRSGRDYRTGEFGDEWFLELVVPVEEKGS